ncbi:MAG: right-handed parallel beta-helix repeat-containing protein, partial [Lentisphaeria bacterium]|nr:right-handed parallel beta-helix repeat-containing protein [Lentisphaeria bacterium]
PPLPPEFTEGDPAWILETQAELQVENTRCFPLNGRGVLASGLRNIHISGCTFHTYGAGVFIPGDFNYWYESGPVAHAVIENNFFDNCCNSPGGVTREPLAVFPELRQLEDGFYYHGSITVRNNRFRADKRCLISMLSVAEATVEGNCFEYDTAYPFIHRGKSGYFFTDDHSPMAAFLHCGKITLGDNPGFEY